MTMNWTTYHSSLGPLTLVGGRGGLSSLSFPGRETAPSQAEYEPAAFLDVTQQLGDYLSGLRRDFDLALDAKGTAFQREVWARLLQIPYGETVSYSALAGLVDRPDHVRAVAGAVARTPIAIVIPCHRVVGANGALTGYGGGLERKAALLSLERRVATGRSPEPAWAFRQEAMQV